MAFQAESTKVGQVALTAAFRDRNNVVGVPDRFPGPDLPFIHCKAACSASQLPQPGELGDTVQSARSADAFVALQYSLAKMARIRSEPPLFHTPFRTEGPASGRNLEVAPAAHTPAVLPFRNRVTRHSAPGHCALGTHKRYRLRLRDRVKLLIDWNSVTYGQGVCLIG